MAARDEFALEDAFALKEPLAPENTAGPSAAVMKILDGPGASLVSVREVVTIADSHGDRTTLSAPSIDAQQAPDTVVAFA